MSRLQAATPTAQQAARQTDLLKGILALAGELPREALPDFLADLERVRARVVLSAAVAVPSAEEKPDRILTPKEAAGRCGRSVWWVYANKAVLPIVRFPTGGYGLSEKALEGWLRRRTG